MNAKRILAIMVACIMVFSSMAFAGNAEIPSDLPEAIFTALDKTEAGGLDLDYVARFETKDDTLNLKYENYHVDFELTLSNDATVILAGQYDNWSDEWVALVHPEYETEIFTKEGTKIEGGKPFRVCYDGMGAGFAALSKIENPDLTDEEVKNIQDGFVFSYRMIYNSVKSFNCGLKFAEGTPDGTTATLKLFLYEKNWPDDDEATGDIAQGGDNEKLDENGVKYQIGDTLTYTYRTFEPEATATDAEIVAEINKIDFETTELTRPYEDVEDAIKSLSPEAKEEVAPSVIKALVENKEEIDAAGVYVVDDSCAECAGDIVYSYAEDEAEHPSLETANTVVYDITATCNGCAECEPSVPVLVALPVVGEVIQVNHVHNGVVEPLEFVQEGNMVYFAMSKFSQVGITTKATPAAGGAVLGFEPTTSKEGEASFNLVLEGDDAATIKNFVSGEFFLETAGNSASFDYDLEVVPEKTTITLLSDENGVRKYKIHLNEFDKNSSWSAVANSDKFILGKLTVRSYGSGSISVLPTGLLVMKHDDSAENLAKELPTVPGAAAIFDIVPPMNDLTVEIAFNNSIVNTEKTYQDMTLTVSGGDLKENLVYAIGKDVPGVVFDEATCTYTVAIKDTLTEDIAYNVEVTGAGYRTARYTVNMRTDKKVLFWNNVKDSEKFMEESAEGNKAPATVNYLAGDIVKDNIINIYDLSAVVSYFGEEGLNKDVNPGYAKYDLNRDGKIDSKDVAYVLVSWGK